MENALKNLLYAGVGLAAEANERIQKEVDQLVEKGKTTDSEAKNIIEDLLSKTNEKSSEFETKFNELVEKFGYAKKTEVQDLEKKVADLESKLASKTKATTAKTTK